MISSSSCFCLLFGASPWGLHGMVCLSVPGELWVTRNFSFNGTGFRSQLLSHFYMNKLRTRHRSKRPRFWSQLLLTVWMILHKFNHHIKKKKKKRKAGERCRLCFLQVPSSLVSLWRQVEWPEFQPLNSREAERQAAVETLHASQTTSYKSTAYTCLSGKWAEKGIHFRKSNCVKELIPEESWIDSPLRRLVSCDEQSCRENLHIHNSITLVDNKFPNGTRATLMSGKMQMLWNNFTMDANGSSVLTLSLKWPETCKEDPVRSDSIVQLLRHTIRKTLKIQSRNPEFGGLGIFACRAKMDPFLTLAAG